MRHESAPTERQEWEKFSNEIQNDIDEVLAKLTVDIEVANTILADKLRTEPGNVIEYGKQAVEYLNKEWGYHDDVFLVSGTWYKPRVGHVGGNIVSRHEKCLAFTTVRSQGFTIKAMQDEEAGVVKGGKGIYKIGLSFSFDPITIDQDTMTAVVTPKAFANPNEVSLWYLRPKDPEVVSSDLAEVSDAIHRADSLVKLITEHRDSNFYKLSPKRQQAVIDSIVESVESTLPLPESYDVLSANILSRLVYVQGYQNNDYLAVVAPLEPFHIKGNVAGVTVIPSSDKQASSTASITPEQDEYDLTSRGLSLIVQPEAHSLNLANYNGNILIPTRAAEAISLHLA